MAAAKEAPAMAARSNLFFLSLVYLMVAKDSVVLALSEEKNVVVTITDENYEQIFTGEWMVEL